MKRLLIPFLALCLTNLIVSQTVHTDFVFQPTIGSYVDDYDHSHIVRAFDGLHAVNKDTFQVINIPGCGTLPSNIDINSKNEIYCMPELTKLIQLDPHNEYQPKANYTCDPLAACPLKKYFIGNDIAGAFCTDHVEGGNQISMFNTVEKKCYHNFINNYNLQVMIENQNKIYTIHQDQADAKFNLGYYNKDTLQYTQMVTLPQTSYEGMKFFKDNTMIAFVGKIVKRPMGILKIIKVLEIYSIHKQRFSDYLDITNSEAVKVFDDFVLVFGEKGQTVTKYTMNSDDLTFTESGRLDFQYGIEPKFKEDDDTYFGVESNEKHQGTLYHIGLKDFAIKKVEAAPYEGMAYPFKFSDGSEVTITPTGYGLKTSSGFSFTSMIVTHIYTEPEIKDSLYVLSVDPSNSASKCSMHRFNKDSSKVEAFNLEKCPFDSQDSKILAVAEVTSGLYDAVIWDGSKLYSFKNNLFQAEINLQYTDDDLQFEEPTAFLNQTQSHVVVVSRPVGYVSTFHSAKYDLSTGQELVKQVSENVNHVYKLSDTRSLLVIVENGQTSLMVFNIETFEQEKNINLTKPYLYNNVYVPCGSTYAQYSDISGIEVIEHDGSLKAIALPGDLPITSVFPIDQDHFGVQQTSNGFSLLSVVNCGGEDWFAGDDDDSDMDWGVFLLCCIAAFVIMLFVCRYFARKRDHVGLADSYYKSSEMEEKNSDKKKMMQEMTEQENA